MNYSKIIKICQKRKVLHLYFDKGMQWISDGSAIYPLLGLPVFDETTIRNTYGLSADVRIEEKPELPSGLNLQDVDPTENQVFYERIQLPVLGGNLISLRTQCGVTFVDRKYLDPIEDAAENGHVGLYERINESGLLYIVVKRGMMLEAAIMPVANALQKDWLDDLKELTARLIETYNGEA